MKTYTILAILVLALVPTVPLLPVWPAAAGAPPAAAEPMAAPAADWGRLPLYFVANQGQLDARVAYSIQGRDKALYFTPQGVTLALALPQEGGAGFLARFWRGIDRWTVRLDFLGANAVRPRGREQTEAVVSYFKGAPGQWNAGLPTYSQIVYQDLWAGIDLAYSGTAGRLKYEFVVQPGADPAQIRLAYRGAAVRLDEAGRLRVQTPVAGFYDDAPVAYQEVDGQRVPVAVAYDLADDTTSGAGKPRPYGFRLGAYDPALPLVIDPALLLYCGFIGGSDDDYANDIALDAAGNAYVTGFTLSGEATFPTAVGPDTTFNGDQDAFVAKVNAGGTGFVYAGYIGGSDRDKGYGVAVDAAGNAYIAGLTESDDFPAATGPDITPNGGIDGFVAKVNAAGTALVYAGYIGGSGDDDALDIAVDAAGSAYLAVRTRSLDAFTVVGPDLTWNGGSFDGFVAKVRPDGADFVYAGYIGGSGYDYTQGIAVDAAGNAYVTGYAGSDEQTFPVVVGPDLTVNSSNDAFVAKVLADGTGLVYCGYIGGSEGEQGNGIAVDAAGSAYVIGDTRSDETTFPDGDGFGALPGPDRTFGGGNHDAFVAKVLADGSGLAYAGYIGGSVTDQGLDIVVDAAGSAYAAGWTNSAEDTFPVTRGPDTSYNGGWDAFVAQVRADGSEFLYAGYIGGSDDDNGLAVATDGLGSAYVVGYTESGDLPVVGGPDTSYNGGDDAFVARIVVALEGVALAGPPVAVVGGAATFTAIVSPTAATRPITYAWQATGQAPITHTAGLSDTAAFAWTLAGTQTVTVTAVNLCGVEVSAARAIVVVAGWRVFLPLVVKR